MIEYGTIERKEGSYGLQEVVKDYIPLNRYVRNYYDLKYLKIVRTPNCHKLVNSDIVGTDYIHYVYFCGVVNNRKCYFGPGKRFSDDQNGLNEAEQYAEHILLEYGRNKWHHPKKWKFIKH